MGYMSHSGNAPSSQYLCQKIKKEFVILYKLSKKVLKMRLSGAFLERIKNFNYKYVKNNIST